MCRRLALSAVPVAPCRQRPALGFRSCLSLTDHLKRHKPSTILVASAVSFRVSLPAVCLYFL